MSSKFKRCLAFLMIIAFTLNIGMMSFAQANYKQVYSVAVGENLEHEIIVEEHVNVRTTKLYDKSGELIMHLELDKTTGTLTNIGTGATISKSGLRAISPEVCNVLRDTDYEYEFCSLGDTYSRTESVSYLEIYDMINTTASESAQVAQILAILVGLAGVGVLLPTVTSMLQDLAREIFDSILAEDLDDRWVELKFTFSCRELWESDSSYPGGGFYYLGYVVSNLSTRLIYP